MPAEAMILEPQFSNGEQQRSASIMGMWVFLATELLLFGGIITAFLAMRVFYPFDFAGDAGRLNVLIGGVNTFILLASSLTMALAVDASQKGQPRLMLLYLPVTALLGAGFLGLKGYEYYDDWASGIVPSTSLFSPGEENPDRLKMYMMFYFVLTGLHAIHLTIGIGLVSWVIARTARKDLPREGATVTEVVGLYWHFVDFVWIFLFSLLYLSGTHRVADLHF